MRDAIVIGAGPNGLVTAAYLARRGWKPLVLERREEPGGVAGTEEIHPGFRCPALLHSTGPFHPAIARDLELARHGLQTLRPEVRVFAPTHDGRALLLYDDPARTSAELSRFSQKDSASWTVFHESLARIARVLSPLLLTTPPSIDSPSVSDLWRLFGVGRGFRGLPRRDAFRLLRWGPMAVADFASEWFETEPLRAVVAARGISGAFAGPWSAGTTANLLLRALPDPHSAGPGGFVKGGPGALARALAETASRSGAEIRAGAEAARILVREGRAQGVALSSGEEIPARVVVSSADPQRTLLRLLDPAELDPDFLSKIRAFRCSGSAAKVNLALSALPRFTALPEDGRHVLSGRIHIGPEIDSLERAFDAAKYGEPSAEPYLDVTIPSLSDPTLAPSGAHVMSVHVQYAPYRLRKGDWGSARDALGETVVRTLATYAPGIERLVVARRILSPVDIETEYGLTGGHLFHGELSLDQLFTMRPLLGWAQYRTPVRGLYLCGSGTHPGGGITGASGANAAREILKDVKRKT
jgi:phytoene dehydrogenase-like protein